MHWPTNLSTIGLKMHCPTNYNSQLAGIAPLSYTFPSFPKKKNYTFPLVQLYYIDFFFSLSSKLLLFNECFGIF